MRSRLLAERDRSHLPFMRCGRNAAVASLRSGRASAWFDSLDVGALRDDIDRTEARRMVSGPHGGRDRGVLRVMLATEVVTVHEFHVLLESLPDIAVKS